MSVGVSGARTPSLYQQGTAPNNVGAFLGSSQIYPIPSIDDLWVDTQNHLVKRCISVNPYTWASIEGGGGSSVTPANRYHAVTAASNNAASIKSAPGTVYGVSLFNAAGYPLFVKLYDLAGAPNPALDSPAMTISVQAGTENSIQIPNGVTFSNGIAIAIVKGIADNDNTAVTVNDAVVDVFYL